MRSLKNPQTKLDIRKSEAESGTNGGDICVTSFMNGPLVRDQVIRVGTQSSLLSQVFLVLEFQKLALDDHELQMRA